MTALMRRARSEGGFTLVELMMAIAIMGIVIGPMTAALIVGLRTSDETSNRISASNDAQLVSVWLTPDVQSAGNSVSDIIAGVIGNTDCSGVSNVLRLQWRETVDSVTNTYVAAYAVVAGSDNSWKLVRYACSNGGAAITHVIARNLASATAASATVSGTKVSLTITENKTPTESSNYTFTVSGNRRTA